MILRLFIAFIGNLIDMIATLYLVNCGYHEANFVMRSCLHYPPFFIFIKLILMSYVVYKLWQERNNKIAILLSYFAAIVYGFLSIYYFIFIGVVI